MHDPILPECNKLLKTKSYEVFCGFAQFGMQLATNISSIHEKSLVQAIYDWRNRVSTGMAVR